MEEVEEKQVVVEKKVDGVAKEEDSILYQQLHPIIQTLNMMRSKELQIVLVQAPFQLFTRNHYNLSKRVQYVFNKRILPLNTTRITENSILSSSTSNLKKWTSNSLCLMKLSPSNSMIIHLSTIRTFQEKPSSNHSK